MLTSTVNKNHLCLKVPDLMGTILTFQSFLIPFYLILFGCGIILVSGQCQINQHATLIQLKKKLQFNYSLSTKLVSWNPNTTDCCTWAGVTCRISGQVIGLDLSNEAITGGIEDSSALFNLKNLERLNLAENRFNAAEIPSSFGKLAHLSLINLSNNNFSGQIPKAIQNLTQLKYIYLSSNNFIGQIPSLHMFKNLTQVDLSQNDLSGVIPSAHFLDLENLVVVDLSFNGFKGSIPSSLFSLQKLEYLQLSDNNFDGLLANITNPSVSSLDTLDLSRNKLEGDIPSSIFELGKLSSLALSSNKLGGTIRLSDFFQDSLILDLSFNNLSITTSDNITLVNHLPSFGYLNLASCNLLKFPNLRNQSRLTYLDLSNNKIEGNIPNWIWEVGNGQLYHMNLSHNSLTSLEEPYSFPDIDVLDLHSNHLSGVIPVLPQYAQFIDYSNNLFNSSLPESIWRNLSDARFFSVSNNLLTGVIPHSICNAPRLSILDMSNNQLNGSIPGCLIEKGGILRVLSLANNSLSGRIEGTFPSDCGLQTLDLHENHLEGKIPESLTNCTMLEVLNLGKNQINDTYPCPLSKTNLRVLVLRSNRLHGSVVCGQNQHNKWSKLQILDIAHNSFSGTVPADFFRQWGAMMTDENGESKKHLSVTLIPDSLPSVYQDSVTVTVKGLEIELVKILTVFTSIDISSNQFSGEIPTTIGQLKALYFLNISHNEFTGSIPPSIRNLSHLESLDMSSNRITGEIPSVLTSLPFLSSFNLSYNQLKGTIPTGRQFNTFDEYSYIGNKRLCGFPLNRTCTSSVVPVTKSSANSQESDDENDWQSLFYGMGVGAGSLVVVSVLYILWKGYSPGLRRQTNLSR